MTAGNNARLGRTAAGQILSDARTESRKTTHPVKKAACTAAAFLFRKYLC